LTTLMCHLRGWVLQRLCADIRNISKPLQISDKFFGWQVIWQSRLGVENKLETGWESEGTGQGPGYLDCAHRRYRHP
jgi:hypothetical protein